MTRTLQKNIDDSNIRKFYSQILQAEITLQDTEEDLMFVERLMAKS